MTTLEIQLPDQTVAGLDRDPMELAAELRVAAAVKWFELGRVSQEVAAEIAGVSRTEFLSRLSRMAVSPIQETPDEASASAKHLRGEGRRDERLGELLALRGTVSDEDAAAVREEIEGLRSSWRTP